MNFFLDPDKKIKAQPISHYKERYLQTCHYYCIAAIKHFENENSVLFYLDTNEQGKADPLVCLPAYRDLWEHNQDKYWMFVAGGANIYLNCKKTGKIYSLNCVRSPWLSTDPNRLSCFSGLPGWNRHGALAEHYFQASVAAREILEECLIILPNGQPLFPDVITKNYRFPRCDIIETLTKSAKMLKKSLGIKMKPEPVFALSRFLKLNGQKNVQLVNGAEIWHDERFEAYGLPVCGTNSRNFNLVDAIVMDCDFALDDLRFVDGEDGPNRQLLNRKFYLLECQENFKLKRQANGDVVVAAVYQDGLALPQEQWLVNGEIPKPGYLLEAIDQAII